MKTIRIVFISLITVGILLVVIKLNKFLEYTHHSTKLYVLQPHPTDLSDSNSTAVESPDLSSTWVIIGFTDYKYVPSAKLWYERLSNLGYSSHVIGTLDKTAYTQLNSSHRVLHFSDRITRLSDIWRIRMQATLELLKKGYNVFLSDVDSIWLRHVPLKEIEKRYDAVHAYGTIHPPNVYKKWGFVVCGCIAGYRTNNKTIELFEKLASNCSKLKEKCDDQRILNNAYAYDYGMIWKGQEGYSRRHDFTAYLFPRQEVQRGYHLNCSATIISPMSDKRNEAKIKMLKEYNTKCGLSRN